MVKNHALVEDVVAVEGVRAGQAADNSGIVHTVNGDEQVVVLDGAGAPWATSSIRATTPTALRSPPSVRAPRLASSRVSAPAPVIHIVEGAGSGVVVVVQVQQLGHNHGHLGTIHRIAGLQRQHPPDP
mgnify:CR=1 FL=1